MYGSYSACEIKGFEGLVITWGHSKDHLPNRKQTKKELIVDGNGVVRLVRALDGNESDSTWNTQAIKDLRESLGKDIDRYTYILNLPLWLQIANELTHYRDITFTRFSSEDAI
jgi:transposase